MSTTVVLACLGLLAAVQLAAGQSCSNSTCSANTLCRGYSNQVCTNTTNNATYNGPVCYASSNCAGYTQVSGDMTITLNGAAPDLIYNYYSVIQAAVVKAYNDYCKAGTNFRLCCPNSVSWPNQATEANNKTAMASNAEVQIPSSSGSTMQTVLVIRLAPISASLLCTAVTYPTTAGATAATTMAATTMAATATNMAATTMAATTMGATTMAATTMPATTMAATTMPATTMPATTMAPTTTWASTSATTRASNSSSNSSASGRRKREIAFENIMAENDDTEDLLQRSRRSITISLPANTVSAIASSVSLTAVIQTALSTSANITVTVTVTTSGATTTSSNVASNLDSNRLLMSCTAILALLAFSLRHST